MNTTAASVARATAGGLHQKARLMMGNLYQPVRKEAVFLKVFDLHCDTIARIERQGGSLVNSPYHISLDRIHFDAYAQVFALFLPDELRGQAAIEKYEALLRCFRRELEQNSERIMQARTGAELTRVLESGRCAAVLSVEGGSALAGELSRVETLARDGVRFLTLTWNAANEIAGGCREPGGLTAFGRALLPELRRCGIVPDVSHLSDEGIDDVLSLTDGPVVATHSNARPVCAVPRNLRDEHFKELVRRGGLVGINYSLHFLRGDEPERADLPDILRHVEHFLALGGENTLALGSDYDGTDVPQSIATMEKVANLYAFMLESISDAAVVEKLFFENARRFCQNNFM